MGMFNFVLDSFKGEIFDFKIDRQVLVASTVSGLIGMWYVVFHENYSTQCTYDMIMIRYS